MQHYDLKVNYLPGNQLLIADTLGRASQSESTLSADEFEVHLLIQISMDKASKWKRETDSDPVLSRLREVVLREAARIFRESKISNKKSNFFLFCQNIPFCELVSKKIF